MAKRTRKTLRRRRRILAWAAAAAMTVAVGLAVLLLVVSIWSPTEPPGERVPGSSAPGAQPPATSTRKPRPAFQDASCPDVQLVSVPGTWESSLTLDPLNPTEFPLALLLNVTRPITEQFDASRVQVYTVPYTAQFHNPLSNDGQQTYNYSRREGFDATVAAITDMNDKCPLTSYVLVGFSQGAVIVGDIASDIGNGRGPVDEDLVLGVTVIADGRREQPTTPDKLVGQDIGPNPPGQGAEITLAGMVPESFGMTMTGPRDGGFGTLNDRVNEICAPGDLICAAPKEAFSLTRLPSTLDQLAGGAGQPVHAMYATTDYWSLDGQSATQWTLDWTRNLIENAPQPKHG